MTIRPEARDALDRLLEGKSPEVQARTWRVITELKEDVAQDFFVVFVALNEFSVLTESAPKEWRELFKELRGDLDQWSHQNLSTLEGLKRQTRNLTAFSELVTNLSAATNNLATTTTDLSKASISLVKQSQSLQKTLSEYEPLFRESVSIRESNQAIIKKVLERCNKALNVSSILSDRMIGIGVLVVNLMIFGVVCLTLRYAVLDYFRSFHTDCSSGAIASTDYVCRQVCAHGWISSEHSVCQRDV